MTSPGEYHFQQVNTIQLLHLSEINMMFYGAEYNNIEQGLQRSASVNIILQVNKNSYSLLQKSVIVYCFRLGAIVGGLFINTKHCDRGIKHAK
jgi:hypothetical protein